MAVLHADAQAKRSNSHAYFDVGQVGHNGALGTEFSHTTVTLANARLIPSFSKSLVCRLIQHVAKTVEV